MRLRRFATPDSLAVLILLALWFFFFWRLFTPVLTDQASLEKGDFSGQFVAFAAYQYDRFADRDIPLWNPYNNGGFPFVGDTQAAAFYPPRLAALALSALLDRFSYHTLELEMTIHVLAASLFMYALVRRLILHQSGSVFGALVAAIIFSYGGFMQSYPPLQLALLEAAIWLPLAILGLHEATRHERLRWSWIVLTGFAYGLSWLAGHPQTTFFITYLLIAYFIYRARQRRYPPLHILAGLILFGALGGALAAIQLLPGVEYLMHTARTGLTFEAKGNGFPFQDVLQFIFPGILSQWSPLYVGLLGFILALIALWRRLPDVWFWFIVALIALGLSFGANSPIYDLLYNIVPGLRFFRGQERAAFLIAFSLALMAGLAASHLISWDKLQDFKATRRIQQALIALALLCGLVTILVFVGWLGDPETFGTAFKAVTITLLLALLSLALLPWLLNHPQQIHRPALLLALLVFDLFTLSLDSPYNYDPVPPDQQLSLAPTPLVNAALADTDIPFRVDGFRGLNDNYGSLYKLADMRGISPLFLDAPYALINAAYINPLAWELFAVRYVYTDWQELPIASEIIATGEDRYGSVNLHRLTDPRPFAHLVDDVRLAENQSVALTITNDPNLNLRDTIILEDLPLESLPAELDSNATAVVTGFQPESFTVQVTTAADTILSLSHPYYPGWSATIDGTPAPIYRAYAALSAVAVPAGEHTITLFYDPLSFKLGALLSLVTALGLAILVAVMVVRIRQTYARN